MARAVGGKAANSVLLDHDHCGVVPIDSLRVGVLTAKDTQRSISIVLSQVGVRAEISPWIKQSLNVFIPLSGLKVHRAFLKSDAESVNGV